MTLSPSGWKRALGVSGVLSLYVIMMNTFDGSEWELAAAVKDNEFTGFEASRLICIIIEGRQGSSLKSRQT